MWNSQSKETLEQPQMWSTHDLACAHCRARKIRCGRERPQCESCKRDGVECRYSSPGKRINHVKLLCQNFEALEDQLNSIQGDLSALTSLVKSGNVGRSAAAASSGDEWALEDFADGDGSTGTRKDRHIVRNEAHSIDRYHGPCSLFTLCREFHDDAIFNTPSSDSTMDNDVTIRMLLQEMCADASKEEHLDIPSEHAGICLPPRQFLTIVVGQFFKNADYATDIFVQSNFQMQLDRVYAHPLSPADEAWAVCFNVIVLLAIGKDQNNQSSSPFIQPFLQTLRMAVNNPRVFLAPRLVNVQALALLSHIAEQYSPPGFAEIVFAQACLLARTMGLHQSRAASEGLTPEEVIEKHKVFRSLYIRDKNIAICRGSSSWLPTYDSSISPLSDQLNDDESKYAPRIELARIQDEVYRHFHSAEAPSLPPSKHFHLLSRFEQKLERWATTHRITQKSTTSPDAASLMLSFFATRLCVFRGSDDQRVAHQAFKDAKASCIIFLLATTSSPSPDPNLTTTLDQLLNRKRSPTSSPFSSPEDSCCDASHDDVDGAAATAAMSQLTASFPLAALFLVAKNVFGPITPGDDLLARTEEEILLLEALRDRYAAITDHDLIESFTRKLSRTLDTLVRIVRQKRYPEAANTPSMIFNDLASLHSSSSSRKDTPSGPDTHSSSVSMQASATADVDAVPSSSLLLPFMQPLNSSSPSPCFGSTNNIQWQSSYKQQVDSAGRVGKRPRLASQSEMFDITTAFADRPDDDQFSMFDFLGGGNDIPVFEGED
ncbi:Fc.00g091750.m01.CDS01 [Cosmosporella sp. VM-42]